jgi:hypothetical protein
MAYNISWYIENRVMLIEIVGRVDIDEFERLHNEAFDYVAKSPYKVHAIADLAQFDGIPTNFKILAAATNKEKTANQGMTILVMPKLARVIRFVASLIMQTLRLEYRMCETVDEALQILQNVDMSLYPLKFAE